MNHKPFEIERITLNVWYTDEDGHSESFRADAPTVEMAIEKVGAIERKLQVLKQAHERGFNQG